MASLFYTLITGASEGFGKALALECAHRKMNLVLVALPGIELTQLAAMLRAKYGVAVISIEKDLCTPDGCREVFEEVDVSGAQVNMLINNAGVGSTTLFEAGALDLYQQQIKLNVLATVQLTHLFLDMLKRNQPAYVLNVGSLACFYALPKKQVYGATKSFIYYFSRSLRQELQSEGVSVSVLCPGGMYTNQAVTALIKAGTYLSRLSSMEPERAVPAALNGLLAKKAVIVPGRLNQCFLVLNAILPAFIKTLLMNTTMNRLNAEPQPPGPDTTPRAREVFAPWPAIRESSTSPA